MVNEDAEKAQRELAWKRYRELAQNLSAAEGSADEGEHQADPVVVLKDTLLKVLEEAEQLVSPRCPISRSGHSWDHF